MRKFLLNHKFLLGVILLFALGIRLVNLDWGITTDIPGHSFYADEPNGYATIKNIQPFSGEIYPGIWSTIKGTFYYELMGGVNEILNKNGIKRIIFPEINSNPKLLAYYDFILLRSISLFFSIAIVFLIYVFCRDIFKNKKMGLISAFTFSLFGISILHSILLKGDSLMSLLGFLSLYYALRALQEKSNKKLIIASIFSGLCTATKYTGGLTVLPIAISLVFINFPKLKWSIKKFRKFMKDSLKMSTVFVIFFLIGAPFILTNFDMFVEAIRVQTQYQSGEFLGGADQLPRFIFYFSNVLTYGIGLAFTILVLLGVFHFIKNHKNKQETIIIFSWITPYYITISSASWITARYALPLLPIFAVLIGYFIVKFHEKNKSKAFQVVIVVLYTFSSLFTFNLVEATHQAEASEAFKEYVSLKGKAEFNNNITYLSAYETKSSHAYHSYPVNIDHSFYVLDADLIRENPQIEIPSQYFLASSPVLRNLKRINRPNFREIFERLDTEFKLVKTFKKDYKLPFITNENTFYPSDIEVFVQKYHLYKKVEESDI